MTSYMSNALAPAVSPAQKMASRRDDEKQAEQRAAVAVLQANWKRWLLCSTIIAGGYHG